MNGAIKMCCPTDCDPNLKPGDPLPCPECREDYVPVRRKYQDEDDLVEVFLLVLGFIIVLVWTGLIALHW